MADELPTPIAPAPSRLRRAGAVAIRLAFDLLVIDAVYETWQSATPLRAWFAGGALLYFGLTAYVLSRGGRIGGRGWLMDPAAPIIVFLGFLVGSTWYPAATVAGVRALGQPTPIVLAASILALTAAAAVRMAAPGGARSWWVRGAFAAVAGYAAAAFALAIAAHSPFTPLLTGHGFWPGVPWWLQGTWLGAFVILPIACARELGAAIARLAVFPYLRWMLLFGCGCWIAINVASF